MGAKQTTLISVDISKQPLLILSSDHRTGNLAQSLGTAAALGWKNPKVWELEPRFKGKWARALPVRWRYSNWPHLTKGIVIGTGWQVSRVMRVLKRDNPRLFTIQLQRPSGYPQDYDVVAMPEHDVGCRWREGSNVFVTLGATNRVTPAILAKEARRWQQRLKKCPKPRLAIMIGGDTRRSTMRMKALRELLESAIDWARTNQGSLLVTTSRRTSMDLTELTQRILNNAKDVPYYFWCPTYADNPYMAYLATCEAVLVTADSVSMVSEAATAGKQVYMGIMAKVLPRKFARFFAIMENNNWGAPWNGKLTLRKTKQRLDDTAEAAAFIKTLLEQHLSNHSVNPRAD